MRLHEARKPSVPTYHRQKGGHGSVDDLTPEERERRRREVYGAHGTDPTKKKRPYKDQTGRKARALALRLKRMRPYMEKLEEAIERAGRAAE